MRLFLADCALERARLALAEHDLDTARLARDEAAALISETGYHGRDAEQADLDRSFAG